MSDGEKIRTQIEAIFEKAGIENYIVIFADDEITWDMYSLKDISLAHGIIGFMEYIKYDLLKNFFGNQYTELEEDEL